MFFSRNHWVSFKETWTFFLKWSLLSQGQGHSGEGCDSWASCFMLDKQDWLWLNFQFLPANLTEPTMFANTEYDICVLRYDTSMQYSTFQEKSLPRNLYIQADNSAKDNKNYILMGFLANLVQRNIFKKVLYHYSNLP